MVRMKWFGLILVTLVLVSCSGQSARVDDGSITLMPANEAPAQTVESQESQIPLLPQDEYVSPEQIVSRRGSIAAEVHLKGNQHFLVDGDASPDDDTSTCVLVAESPDRCWAMYRFENLITADDPDMLTVALSEVPDNYLVGWSDYATSSWSWTYVDAPSGEDSCPLPTEVQPISPGGNVYALVAVVDAQQATVDQLSLGLDTDAPPPVGFGVSNGLRGDLIRLAWTDPASTYPELTYEQIQIERSLDPRGPWAMIGYTVPGVTAYDDIHEGTGDGQNNVPYNDPVYYRLRTVVSDVAGPAGLTHVGYRFLAVVENLAASDGTYHDQVLITWDYDRTDSDGYVIEYKGAAEPEENWRLLDSVTGNGTKSYSHTKTHPSTEEGSELNVSYNYRARATFMGEESLADSNIDAGYRGLGNVGGLVASDGTYHDRVAVSWDPVENADGYNLYYKLTSGTSADWEFLDQINDGATTSYDHMYNGPAGEECAHNTSYDYRAKATFDSEESPYWSNVDAGYRVIGQVSNTAATAGDYHDKVVVNWDSLTYAASYKVYYKQTTQGEEGWTWLDDVSSGETCDHEWDSPTGRECAHNTSYDYRVTAMFDGDEGPTPSTSDSGYRVLGDVSNLVATDAAYYTKVVISWDAVTGADGYEIEYKLDTEGEDDWSLLDTVTGGDTLSFEHTESFPVGKECINATIYDYRARATFNTDYSPNYSNVDSGYRAVGNVQNLSATDGDYYDEVLITWDVVTGADGYNLYYKETAQGDEYWDLLTTLTGDTSNSFNHTDSAPSGKECADNVSYDYRCKSTFGGEEALEYSNVDAGYRIVQPPANLTATHDLYDDKVVLNWDASPGATGYQIFRDDQGSYLWQQTGTTKNDTIGDYDDHTYWVKAYNAAGTSEFSNSAVGSRLGWQTYVVNGYPLGRAPSLALVNSFPFALSYNASTGVVASRSTVASPTGAGQWAIHNSGGSAEYTSIIDLNGQPAYVASSTNLVFYRATTPTPVSSDDWVHHTIATNTILVKGGLRICNGVPVCVYYNRDTHDLYYAEASSATPSATEDWNCHVIYGSNAGWASLAIIDGKPHTAFYQTSSYDLYYARATSSSPASSSDWTVMCIDSADTVGLTPSIANINGKPHIAYRKWNFSQFRYAYASVAEPTSGGQFTKMWFTPATNEGGTLGYGEGGFYLCEVDGFPSIIMSSKASSTGAHRLEYARSVTLSPTSINDWVISVIATQTDYYAPGENFMVDNNGKPQIVYRWSQHPSVGIQQSLKFGMGL